jgi:hypothetical protein
MTMDGTIDWNDSALRIRNGLRLARGELTREDFVTDRLTTTAGSPIADIPNSIILPREAGPLLED